MKVGDVITIYRDPLTREEPSGEAELMYLQNPDAGVFEGHYVQQWLVRYVGDVRQYSRRTCSMGSTSCPRRFSFPRRSKMSSRC